MSASPRGVGCRDAREGQTNVQFSVGQSGGVSARCTGPQRPVEGGCVAPQVGVIRRWVMEGRTDAGLAFAWAGEPPHGMVRVGLVGVCGDSGANDVRLCTMRRQSLRCVVVVVCRVVRGRCGLMVRLVVSVKKYLPRSLVESVRVA